MSSIRISSQRKWLQRSIFLVVVAKYGTSLETDSGCLARSKFVVEIMFLISVPQTPWPSSSPRDALGIRCLPSFALAAVQMAAEKKKEYGSDPKHIGEANKHVVTCEFRQQRKGSQSESKNICQITHSFRKLTIGGCTMGVGSCRHEHGRSN